MPTADRPKTDMQIWYAYGKGKYRVAQKNVLNIRMRCEQSYAQIPLDGPD